MNTTYSFQQINNALANCSSFYLTKETNSDGEPAFALRDGCGEQDGDLFDDIYDVQAYVTDNQDVFNYLARYN